MRLTDKEFRAALELYYEPIAGGKAYRNKMTGKVITVGEANQ
jgi:hypothetical protein